jgi:hypothetical protein
MDQPGRSGGGGPPASDGEHLIRQVRLPGIALSTAERGGVGGCSAEIVMLVCEGRESIRPLVSRRPGEQGLGVEEEILDGVLFILESSTQASAAGIAGTRVVPCMLDERRTDVLFRMWGITTARGERLTVPPGGEEGK